MALLVTKWGLVMSKDKEISGPVRQILDLHSNLNSGVISPPAIDPRNQADAMNARCWPVLVVLFLFIGVVGCNEKTPPASKPERAVPELTKERLQPILDQAFRQYIQFYGQVPYINPRARIVIQGIQEKPLENSAVVDVYFLDSDLHYRDAISNFTLNYTVGTATLARYTDGRWVLTTLTVTVSNGHQDSIRTSIPVP